MRKEDNFQALVRDKKIIIPIIQRDYAQGRNDPKAVVVRTRLIEEWIDILQHHDLRMDFNYIYGNETNDIFYPVDGQQRLTSLYLLHWYLAHATGNAGEIRHWQFDYKTRNSASEFFAFLRDPDRSKELFNILHSETAEDEKQSAVRNERWFKTKWANDPTVVSCVNFLCMLSGKLGRYEAQFASFWERLQDEKKPAVYFTCLNECDDEYAETDAAKKYTRMNARGKRLTNFENLKAMIDEIEMKHIDDLKYCVSDDRDKLTDTISWSYDRVYVDCFYQSLQESSLNEKTKAINDESEKWFRLIYYVYALIYDYDIPQDADPAPGGYQERYEDVIYKISQERVTDDKITEYLYMIKAVFELLCNSKDTLAYRYNEFSAENAFSRRKAIAFIIFAAELWTTQNSRDDNHDLLAEWSNYEEMLADLCFEDWKADGDKEIARIMRKMISAMKEMKLKSVNVYFIRNDFEKNNPFENADILPDLKCRIIERKIKAKLLNDGVIDEKHLEKVFVGKRRWGYLYYLCGYLNDWRTGNWEQKAFRDANIICSYADLISTCGSVDRMMDPRDAKIVYAYASQYDDNNQCLSSSNEINKCNNEHIWDNAIYNWSDEECGKLPDKRKKQLDHLKVMLDLLLKYKRQNNIGYPELVSRFAGDIAAWFEKSNGYEDCWLRFAVKFVKGGNELLVSELENENGVVKIGKVPVILKTYLVEKGYSYNEKVTRVKDFHRKCTYFTGDDKRVPFTSVDQTCTFAPDPENTGKYQHSRMSALGLGWDLSGNTVNRNMDLFYRAFLNLSGIGCNVKNNFWSVDVVNGEYRIKVYELGNASAGKISVCIREASLDKGLVEQVEKNIKNWKKLFDEVVASPAKKGNYDQWIELWNNDYATAFGSSFSLGAAAYDKNGGQRPRKIWSEISNVPALAWSTSTVYI